MNNSKIKNYYDFTMMGLAIVVLVLFIVENFLPISDYSLKIIFYVDAFALWVFIIDYFTRLILSKNKLVFFKSNIMDLVAILPFSSFFRIARLARVIRLTKVTRLRKLLRIGIWLKRFKHNILAFVNTNGFIYVLLITVITTILGGIGLHFFEAISLSDSLWWSFVTITTVGYGDISPETLSGRVLAGILMLVGIGFIGMLTGTIATFFIRKKPSSSYKNEVITSIKDKLDDFDSLKQKDIDDIHRILSSLKKEC